MPKLKFRKGQIVSHVQEGWGASFFTGVVHEVNSQKVTLKKPETNQTLEFSIEECQDADEYLNWKELLQCEAEAGEDT